MPRAGFGTRLLSGRRLAGHGLLPGVDRLRADRPADVAHHGGALEGRPWKLTGWRGGLRRRGARPGSSGSSRPLLPRFLARKIREREPASDAWQNVAIVSWAGMRGVVSLAAAFAIPLDFAGRAHAALPHLRGGDRHPAGPGSVVPRADPQAEGLQRTGALHRQPGRGGRPAGGRPRPGSPGWRSLSPRAVAEVHEASWYQLRVTVRTPDADGLGAARRRHRARRVRRHPARSTGGLRREMLAVGA